MLTDIRHTVIFSKNGKAILVIVLAMFATYALNLLGTLHLLENWTLDNFILVSKRHAVSDIMIVDISDADYDRIFAGRSPLDPEKLHRLIGAIARSKPKLIAVDVDTSNPVFRNFKIDSTWTSVIWERDISGVARVGEESVEPQDVLGGQSKFNRRSGIPALRDDPEDKVTRLYTQCVDTKAGRIPTFVFIAAVVFLDKEVGQSASMCAGGSKEPMYINYSLDGETSLSASRVLELSDTKENGGAEQIIPEFVGKLVILGGDYRDFDRHFTPLGILPGVVVLANAIETELKGHSMKVTPKWLILLIEFLGGASVVAALQVLQISPIKAAIFGIPLTFLFAIILSLVAFQNGSRWGNFVPTLIAVLIFEIYEHVRLESIQSAVHSNK